ncbi:hypothetical protein Pla123a_20020 [Posidoniimonas polymericola]|uniref:Uncharacterized protein n=1 Tax=Posidoniimonas polymericola TaxID=2528002 RepID=A0A5C5YQW5_9BACT|nr:hypothetical protein [Posidoniimonas polymericola]TWT77342.1 hypothetical protein Pla123a_20020 [Posidoniimonas polymericola]
MSNPRQQHDDLATRLSDGLLSPEEQAQITRRAEQDADLSQALKRDAQVDAALRRAFAPPPPVFPALDDGPRADAAPTAERVSPGTLRQEPIDDPPRSRGRLIWYATAATLAWALFGWQWLSPRGGPEVAFVERPLSEVYETSVREGFQPYWICDDPAVFAETFRRRQGVPLKLEELPEDRVMAGLSYLGGLSDSSTSMLAHVDGRPVIVVVDRLEKDWRPPVGHDEQTDLNVFRVERSGLVLYEVTPLDEPMLLPYFQPLTPANGKADAE